VKNKKAVSMAAKCILKFESAPEIAERIASRLWDIYWSTGEVKKMMKAARKISKAKTPEEADGMADVDLPEDR